MTSSSDENVKLLSTALPITNGGTGQTTSSAAYNALSPMTAAGDITYYASGIGQSALASVRKGRS